MRDGNVVMGMQKSNYRLQKTPEVFIRERH